MKQEEEEFMCFAWLSQVKCNALNYKNCDNCAFFKDRKDVPGYDKCISKKDLEEREKNLCQLMKK